jgi:sec-independent protein translocase protein TatC
MSNQNENNQAEMGFLDHLEILRWHLIRSFVAIIILAIAAFIFRGFIFDTIILAPKTPEFFTNMMLCKFGNYIGVETLCINSKPFQIINIKMAGQFSTHIMVSLVAGFIVAFPYVFWELWSFIRPALHKNEKKHARGAVFFSSLLFILGVIFGYYVIVPLSVHFLGGYNVSNQVLNQINLGSYISTVTSVVLAAGIIFELPIIIYFLSKAGLVTPGFLKKYRRHSLVIILILSAIITPPDIFSQILVALPLLLLYEAGISISKKITAKDESLMV